MWFVCFVSVLLVVGVDPTRSSLLLAFLFALDRNHEKPFAGRRLKE